MLILVLLAFTVLMRWPLPAAVAILIWGIASFALVPPLQMRVMETAQDAPNLASAVNIGAFNFGNAIGAALGGAVINTGLGYPAISLAGAAPPCSSHARPSMHLMPTSMDFIFTTAIPTFKWRLTTIAPS